jgi:hypothetical protein
MKTKGFKSILFKSFSGFQILFMLLGLVAVTGASVPVVQAAPMAQIFVPPDSIPSNFIWITNSNGANDINSEQNDLTTMGWDTNTDPNIIDLFWSWDTTNFTAQKGNGCALFDANDNGNIDFAICAEVENVPSGDINSVYQTLISPLAVTCSDKKPDRCTQPEDLLFDGNLESGNLQDFEHEGNLVTETDPFDDLNPDQTWPYDTTIRMKINRSLVGSSTMVNVCSYPSLGNKGNNNPFDCIVPPKSGYLKITKDAQAYVGDPVVFTFTVDGLTKTITGSGSTELIPLLIGDKYSIVETVPSSWWLETIACVIQDNGSTGTRDGNTVKSVSIKSGKTTTCTFTDIHENPALSVEKSSTTTSLSAPGTVNYSYLVTNTGNVTLTGISLSDNNDNDDMSCPETTLAAGTHMTCTATHTFTQAELDTLKSLDNTVTASSNEAPDATDDLSIPISQNASIKIVKHATLDMTEVTPNDEANVGDVINYSFTVTNTGNVTLHDIYVNDDKAGVVDCYIESLDPDASDEKTCTGSYTLTLVDLDAGTVFNQAFVSANDPNDEAVTDDDDLLQPVPQVSVMVVTKSVTFDISKGVEADSLDAGDTVYYSFVVKNDDNITLKAVVLDEVIIKDPVVVGVHCTIGDLAPGESNSEACTDSFTLTTDDIDATWFDNQISVSDYTRLLLKHQT